MEKENFIKVFKWLKKEFFSIFDFDDVVENETTTKIVVSVYDEYEENWSTSSIYFDKLGNVIPNYKKVVETKNQIKILQEELKNLQKTIDNN